MRKIFLLFLLATFLFSNKNIPFEIQSDGIVVKLHPPAANLTRLIRLQVISDKIIRVTVSAEDTFSTVKSLMVIENVGQKVKWTADNNNDWIFLRTAELIARVSMNTGEVEFTDINGNPILTEKKGGGKTFIPVEIDGKNKYSIHQEFESFANEAYYGLGQHQYDILDYKGKDIDLYQYNTKVSVPLIVSNRNYGILWDNYSLSKFGDIRDYQPITSLKLFSPDGKLSGLRADYYSKSDTSKALISKNENIINYEFLDQLCNVPKEFNMAKGMVKWTGFISSDSTGLHKFRFYSAGYAKVWLNGKLVVDRWRQSWNPTTTLFDLAMAKGKLYPIIINWVPDGEESYISLKYLSPQNKEEQNKLSLYSQLANQIDYYFIKGNNLDEVISGYREITGKAPIMPKWAMGFWQSRERYKSQDEVINTVKEFRSRKIPIDNIVLDWQYWPVDKWGSHEFDSSRFPDPKQMIDDLHTKYNVNFMISVWPKFYTGTDYYNQMNKNGWLYKLNIEKNRKDWIGYVSTFYDAFNPQARNFFWDQINRHLFSKGVDAWWLDASEPDMQSNLSIEERQLLMNPTALGSGAEYFNAYPLENTKSVYEGQRKTNPDRRVFILTRSAYAGQQRYAAATWSGDIGARWEEMKLQIPAALNFSLSGIPYWTMDIGGFAVEDRFQHTKKSDIDEWKELMARWYQFGAFCPIFRSHGQFPFREIFNIASEKDSVYQAILASNQFRYRLMPYIYSLAGQTYFNDYTIMRALLMDFTNDTCASKISDQYMFGPFIMVCPVYNYKARCRKVYLPANTDWYEIQSGKIYKGGQFIIAEAPISNIPVFVKAGSILPIGPSIQYSTEKAPDRITLYIYGGANSTFTLYEDENINYNYEKGAYTEIPFVYNESTRNFTIGSRKGEFAGMLKQRIFNIILIDKNHQTGIKPDSNTGKLINYDGSLQSVAL